MPDVTGSIEVERGHAEVAESEEAKDAVDDPVTGPVDHGSPSAIVLSAPLPPSARFVSQIE